jgi:hypothetical protein
LRPRIHATETESSSVSSNSPRASSCECASKIGK